jgi:dTDP-glucose pyrophosphorylase
MITTIIFNLDFFIDKIKQENAEGQETIEQHLSDTLNEFQIIGYNVCTISTIRFQFKTIQYTYYEPESNYYLQCFSSFSSFSFVQKETLIIDGTHLGLSKAIQTACYIHLVQSVFSCLILDIRKTIKYYENKNCGVLKKSMFQKSINVVIPMVGDARRFIDPRCNDLKSLLNIQGKPMIAWVIEMINIDANYIFIVKDNHYEQLKNVLLACVPNCTIIRAKNKTEGSACSVLLAEEYINNDNPLIIANDNTWLDWDSEKTFLDFLIGEPSIFSKVVTFNSNGSHRYNYVKVNNNNIIEHIANFKPISCFASSGLWMWRSGKEFIKCTHKMISCNKRSRGEFCTNLVANELINESNEENLVKKVDVQKCYIMEDPNDITQFQNFWISEILN